MSTERMSLSSCLFWLGDSALQIDVRKMEPLLGQRSGDIAPSVLAAGIAKLGLDSVIDIVPSYDIVTVHFMPAEARKIMMGIEAWLHQASFTPPDVQKLVDIPVCYEDPFAPDLEAVAALHRMSRDEVVCLHTAPLYNVVMLGFSPGFPYLEGLDSRLNTPRLATPRLSVPAGAVGIGGNQTGIYPAASPGGWRIIGRTPLSLFNPSCDPPCLLSPGMRLRFVPITLEQYKGIMHAEAGERQAKEAQMRAALP